jgi:hypothetical protein
MKKSIILPALGALVFASAVLTSPAHAFRAKCHAETGVVVGGFGMGYSKVVIPIAGLEFNGNTLRYGFAGRMHTVFSTGNPNSLLRFPDPFGHPLVMRRIGKNKFRLDYRKSMVATATTTVATATIESPHKNRFNAFGTRSTGASSPP